MPIGLSGRGWALVLPLLLWMQPSVEDWQNGRMLGIQNLCVKKLVYLCHSVSKYGYKLCQIDYFFLSLFYAFCMQSHDSINNFLGDVLLFWLTDLDTWN